MYLISCLHFAVVIPSAWAHCTPHLESYIKSDLINIKNDTEFDRITLFNNPEEQCEYEDKLGLIYDE